MTRSSNGGVLYRTTNSMGQAAQEWYTYIRSCVPPGEGQMIALLAHCLEIMSYTAYGHASVDKRNVVTCNSRRAGKDSFVLLFQWDKQGLHIAQVKRILLFPMLQQFEVEEELVEVEIFESLGGDGKPVLDRRLRAPVFPNRPLVLQGCKKALVPMTSIAPLNITVVPHPSRPDHRVLLARNMKEVFDAAGCYTGID